MRKKLLVIVGFFILVFIIAGVYGCAASSGATSTPTPTPAPSPTPTPSPTSTTPVPPPELPTIAGVVAKVKPSVVAITDQITTYNLFNQPITGTGAGSGWIIRSDGYIVTNNHVIEGASNIVVTLNDGRTLPAVNVYADPVTDLAVVKIDADNLPALPTGDSSTMNVGDWVVAIGNALGQGISATKGIISAKGISLSESPGMTLHDLVQTDAAINPGNSGGPLVNLAGQVIGINSLKVSQIGVEGMGYAISINQALPIINLLINTGHVTRPWLGINVYTVDPGLAAFYRLRVDKGVLITDVSSGSPADNAGLRPGDVITVIDGQEETDAGALMDYINSLQVGQKIDITYYRGSNQNTVSVTLVASP
jgi:serine protease Do